MKASALAASKPKESKEQKKEVSKAPEFKQPTLGDVLKAAMAESKRESK